MKIKSIIAVLICSLLSFSLTATSIACPPPDCGDCSTWNSETEECEWDCTIGQCCDDGTCVSSCPNGQCCDSGTCVSSCTSGCCDDGTCVTSCLTGECCSSGECVSSCPTGECCDDGTCVSSCPLGECCDDGTCVSSCTSGCCDDGECVSFCSSIEGKECCGGNCITECDGSECIECDDASGTCVSRCSGTTPHCHLRTCVECRDILDCEVCEDCVNNECEHPCDDCVWPEYCGSACACVECYPGTDDTTTCSEPEFNFDHCTGCTNNIINPCSGARDRVVYTGNTLTTCTGPDCETRSDVLCYTTYDECVPGIYIPLLWCIAADIVGDPASCTLNEYPSAGCIRCSPDLYEEGIETIEDRGVCPIEDWP